jgi:hypothetical protein
MSLESSERMEFRFGGENDPDKVWFVYDVGSMRLEIVYSDSQFADQSLTMESGHFSQLLDWMRRVDRRMHGEDTPSDADPGS